MELRVVSPSEMDVLVFSVADSYFQPESVSFDADDHRVTIPLSQAVYEKAIVGWVSSQPEEAALVLTVGNALSVRAVDLSMPSTIRDVVYRQDGPTLDIATGEGGHLLLRISGLDVVVSSRQG